MTTDRRLRHPSADTPARAADPRRALGRLGEELAAAHLRERGFTLLARNARTRYGEIDLIAFDGETLVFAEVKARRVTSRQTAVRPDQEPLARLRFGQRRRLRRLAAVWLREHRRDRPRAKAIRFDAIGALIDGRDRLHRLEHIEGAW